MSIIEKCSLYGLYNCFSPMPWQAIKQHRTTNIHGISSFIYDKRIIGNGIGYLKIFYIAYFKVVGFRDRIRGVNGKRQDPPPPPPRESADPYEASYHRLIGCKIVERGSRINGHSLKICKSSIFISKNFFEPQL